MMTRDYHKTSVLIVGGGVAGLSAAITIKSRQPELEVCVIDKAAGPGNHVLSGAVVEPAPLHELLEMVNKEWQTTPEGQALQEKVVSKDDLYFFCGSKHAFSMNLPIRLAKLFHLGVGQLLHKNDYLLSAGELTAWLHQMAVNLGVEVLYGFAAAEIVENPNHYIKLVKGVKLVDQGRDRNGQPQSNFLPGETIEADVIILAEGCDGYVTEQFVQQYGLQRDTQQVFSIGVKELIRVSPEQYQQFGRERVIQAMGYPLWTPVRGPSMFGGGIVYAMGDHTLAVAVIVGLDWTYKDFNPQDALVHFKNHAKIKPFIEGGTVLEAGAKLIPEGGYHAVPRNPETCAIGKANVIIAGDAAGFVNMLKIKGLHNAIASGIAAGKAVAQSYSFPNDLAKKYTEIIEYSPIHREMKRARNFRQTVAKFGNLIGMPLSVLGNLIPHFRAEKDSHTMTKQSYPFKLPTPFDKDAFTARAKVEHREEQPSHCEVLNETLCQRCAQEFGRPCITFCPAGVYEMIQDKMKPANSSNCVHCKTCQNKCPFDNLRWHVPEGGGGPKYQKM